MKRPALIHALIHVAIVVGLAIVGIVGGKYLGFKLNHTSVFGMAISVMFMGILTAYDKGLKDAGSEESSDS